MEKEYKFNEHQRKWLEALKSGDYEQCKGTLWREPVETGNRSYCCLGVAMELFAPNHNKMVPTGEYNNDETCLTSSCGASLSREVTHMLRLRDHFGALKISADVEDLQFSVNGLTVFNDSAEWSFKQIAEYIENNPENVFDDNY